jgi:hypothetical protein
MGGSVKKIAKFAAPAIGAATGGLGGLAAGTLIGKKVTDDYKKKKAKEKQIGADNAVLAKEAESANTAAKAFEAEEKKKEKRQQGLGAAISGSESTLG